MKIKTDQLEQYRKEFCQSEKNLVAMNAVTGNGVWKSAQNYDVTWRVPHQFSIVIPQIGITNQKNSGRCWLFAAANCLRYQMIKKYNLEEFELSQNYLLFYDKLEKANYFLESILESLNEPLDGRLLSFLLSSPEGDGGQWDMFCNVVQKYGMVPKSAMPETTCSSATGEMRDQLTEKLRQCAFLLRNAHKEGVDTGKLRKEKERMLEDIHRILCICLGVPPQKFDFELRTKDDKYLTAYGITPKEFYEKYIGVKLSDYVSIINAPTEDKPFHRSYTVKYLGNVKEGNPVRYLNLDINQMKQLAVAQLKDGEPVWFGCDVGKSKLRKEGIMELDCYNVEALFDTSFSLEKGQRLDYGQSAMTHAMVFQGVNIGLDGKPNRWKVENSWGDDVGQKGFFVMGDSWFDQYMYQVVVHKKYLSAELLAQYESEPISLEPWDPMGSLALAR